MSDRDYDPKDRTAIRFDSKQFKSFIEALKSGVGGDGDLAVLTAIGQLREITEGGLAEVVKAIEAIQTQPPPLPKPLEVKFMFVVKNDHPPEPFSIVLGEVTDAEGNVIPDAKVDVEVVSTNEDAVSAEFDAEARTGIASFGNAGVAALQATVSSGGKLLGSGAVDFTVTLGDPDAISGINLSFPGLTEAPPPEPPA